MMHFMAPSIEIKRLEIGNKIGNNRGIQEVKA